MSAEPPAVPPIDTDVVDPDVVGPGVHDPFARRILLAVGAGGFIGTLARYQLSATWPAPPGGFPAATFTINVTGAFAIAVVVALVLPRRGQRDTLRPFVVTGVLGGWTTMSTLAVDAVRRAGAGHWAVAGAYVVGGLVASLAAAGAGVALVAAVSRRLHRPDRRPQPDPSPGADRSPDADRSDRPDRAR